MENREISIRPLEERDVDRLVELEHGTFNDPWSKEDYLHLLTLSYACYLVAVCEEIPVGFAGMLILCGEGDIDRVMVDPGFRGMHIATELLTRLFQLGDTQKVDAYTLEVRASNTPAIRLYESLGFVNEGLRPGFYDKPKEDACIMWRR